MDEDRIGLVLARISELRLEITNCIHKASKKDEVESGNGEDAEDGKTHEDDDEAVDCLLKIKDALESLEAQVSSLQVSSSLLVLLQFWTLEFSPFLGKYVIIEDSCVADWLQLVWDWRMVVILYMLLNFAKFSLFLSW